MQLSRVLVVLDLETTGTWVEKDKIIEIGMIKYFPDKTKKEFLKRVNPGIPIPATVSQLIGITNEDIKDAPSFKDIAKDVLEFLNEADIGGFNVEKFDLPLLEREMVEAGLMIDFKKIKIYDAKKVYHLHEKRDLTAAYKFYCNKELINAHTAIADSAACFEILDMQIKKYGDSKSLESLKNFEYEHSSEYFDKERKFRYWNGEIYFTFGKYAKVSVKEVLKKDKPYLTWILGQDFSQEVKSMIKDMLGNK